MYLKKLSNKEIKKIFNSISYRLKLFSTKTLYQNKSRQSFSSNNPVVHTLIQRIIRSKISLKIQTATSKIYISIITEHFLNKSATRACFHKIMKFFSRKSKEKNVFFRDSCEI